ncbi:MAG: hypothetical protein ABIN89_03700 [Chitinophagaceae bacterium]
MAFDVAEVISTTGFLRMTGSQLVETPVLFLFRLYIIDIVAFLPARANGPSSSSWPVNESSILISRVDIPVMVVLRHFW